MCQLYYCRKDTNLPAFYHDIAEEMMGESDSDDSGREADDRYYVIK